MTDALEFAGKPFPPAERRQHSRQQLRSLAYVELDEGNGGIVLNVSEGGLSVQAVVSLMDEQLPRMRIQLPQPSDWVEAGARIAWTGKSRKVVGLEFVDLPEQARSQIREWISQETLPAPAQREPDAEPHENGGAGLAAVASEAQVPVIEPMLAGSFSKDPTKNVSLTTEGGAILPVTQAEEATPTKNSALLSAPTPIPRRTPPTAASSISSATPTPSAPPSDQFRGRVFDRPQYTELKLTGRPRAVAAAATQIPGHKTLATLIALLALVSLAAGWAAGRGAFDGVFAMVHAMTSHKNAPAPEVKALPATPTAPVSEIQVTNSNRLGSAVRVAPPTPAPKQSSRGETIAIQTQEPHEEPMTLQAANSAPIIPPAGYASSLDDVAPLRVTDLRGPANILPPAGSMDSRNSIPPPQVEPQRAVLKPAELIHRVDPVYPAIAKEQRVEGTVKLRVTIGQDGAVHDIEMLSGPPLLVRAATDAVRQWRYSPTMLNGEPIQVDSEVNLEFRLSASSR